MFAIIKTGGKQYKVSEGDVIRVDRLAGEEGDTITLDQVLAVGDASKATIGEPLVSGASVSAEIKAQGRDDKIIVFKKKRRQNYRRKMGHQQDMTLLKVSKIKA